VVFGFGIGITLAQAQPGMALCDTKQLAGSFNILIN
jgi:hypothetical protein